MGTKTAIGWTGHTWNPFKAITYTNPETEEKLEKPQKGWFCIPKDGGCKHCYASTLNKGSGVIRGTGYKYSRPNLKYHEFQLVNLGYPRKVLKKYGPELIFVNSMTDFYLPEIPDSFRHKALDIIEGLPEMEFQVLTKHPEYMLEFHKKENRSLPDNFWLGTSVCYKKNLDRIDMIRSMKASIRFVSFEPLLEDLGKPDLTGIHQAITGGESGKHLTDPEERKERGLVLYDPTQSPAWKPDPKKERWVINIMEAARLAGTSFFHKQWGGYKSKSAGNQLLGSVFEEFPRLPGKPKKQFLVVESWDGIPTEHSIEAENKVSVYEEMERRGVSKDKISYINEIPQYSQ